MKIGIHAGFGQLLGPDLLGELRARGFEVVRIQAFESLGSSFPLTAPELTAALVQEVIDAGLVPYLIIRSPEQVAHVPAGTDLEFGNEPDLGGQFGWPSQREYLELMTAAIELAAGRNPMWVGVVSNLNARGFKFLEGMRWDLIPAWVGCSVHRYPDPAGPFHGHVKPFLGKRWTRDDEIRRLREIVGERPLALSEIGYNAVDFTDQEAADHMRFERHFFDQHGFTYAIAYQMADGPGHTIGERWGFRRFEHGSPLGSWKPVTETWTGVAV